MISEKNNKQRVDKYCLKILPNISKSFLYKMYRKKNITLNGKKIKGNEILEINDEIKMFFADETFSTFSYRHITHANSLEKKRIIYEDEDLLIYNKPTDLLSQPNGKDDNLYEQTYHYLDMNTSDITIGICNRLDKNTTGVTLIGKNTRTLQKINHAIKNRDVRKMYKAIVVGELHDAIEITSDYSKNEQKNLITAKNVQKRKLKKEVNITEYYNYVKKQKRIYSMHTVVWPIAYNQQENITFVQVLLFTGKAHQIRMHMKEIQHPIVGDPKYGNEKVNAKFKRSYNVRSQLLHSYSYTLYHLTEELSKWNHQPMIAEPDPLYRLLFEKTKR